MRLLEARVLRTLILAIPALALAGAAPSDAPEKLDPGAAAVGASSYRGYCASCHGKEARGDGPLAEHLRTAPADLTRLSLENGGTFPFETVVAVIDGRKGVKGHGSTDMPAWGDAFKRTSAAPDEAAVQHRIEQLAHYLWSLQRQPG